MEGQGDLEQGTEKKMNITMLSRVLALGCSRVRGVQ